MQLRVVRLKRFNRLFFLLLQMQVSDAIKRFDVSSCSFGCVPGEALSSLPVSRVVCAVLVVCVVGGIMSMSD